MASVEEICDNISLINQGRNILTGNVDELRREFTRGRYSLDFEGDARSLANAVDPLVSSISFSDAPYGRNRANVTLKPEAALKQLISLSNGAVGLTAVNEAIASMNDIFIQAVNSNNQQ